MITYIRVEDAIRMWKAIPAVGDIVMYPVPNGTAYDVVDEILMEPLHIGIEPHVIAKRPPFPSTGRRSKNKGGKQ